MTDFKQLAIEKLASMGAHVPAKINMEKLADVIGLATGSHRRYYTRPIDFVRTFAIPPKATGKQVNLMKRQAFSWNHPRDAEIERGQPPLFTPKGIGNANHNAGFIPTIDRW